MPLQRLEPCGSKDPCTVLRGLDAGDRVQLPDRAIVEPDETRHRCARANKPYSNIPASLLSN